MTLVIKLHQNIRRWFVSEELSILVQKSPGTTVSKFTRDDMLRAAYRLPNTPLHVEHEAKEDPIGKIISADVNENDELVVVGEITRSSLRGAAMINSMRRGDIKGCLSEQHTKCLLERGWSPCS